METGLGGRLDATNTVEHPIACVITSISLDHTEYLGNTIPEIAGEKAGIIKPGVPLVYDGRNPQSAQVIHKRAMELGCEAAGLTDSMYEVFLKTDKSIDFCLHFGYYENARVTVPYLAEYQVVNSSLALMAMELIDPTHEIGLETRLAGIRKTQAGQAGWRPYCREWYWMVPTRKTGCPVCEDRTGSAGREKSCHALCSCGGEKFREDDSNHC